MKFLGVNIGKLINISCKITGKGGTSLPGKIALKYDSKLIEKLIVPIKNNKVIITGTNGKTTTSGLIASILTTAGKRVVHNKEGANMKTGIATALIKSSNFWGNLQKDATVFEVDEANMPIVIEDVKPNIVVITNFFRDQLDRYGELDTTVEKVKKSLLNLPQDSILLLNADEPFTASIGDEIKSKVFYYGIEDNIEGINSSSFEQKYCPICAHKYEYKKIYYGQLGDYYCPNCGKKRPNPHFKATNIFLNEDGINFNLYYKDKIFTVKSRLIGLYNLYNLLAAISAGILLNIDFSTILKAIESYWPIEGRLQKTKIKGKRTIINLIKNPIGFESTLNMLSQFNKPLNLLISINDNYADGRDVSWLWDVNLESFLSKTKVNYIVTSGLRAEDMAVRLKYAGFDIKKIKIINSIEKALDTIANLTEEELIAVLPNYTSLYDVSKYLKLQEAKKMKLVVGHMYPDLLNLYGDIGNIVALKKRCEWRKIEIEIKPITLDYNEEFADVDLLFLGGGSDREQKIVSDDLKNKKGKNLKTAIEDGLTVLAICGGYQLLGEYYQTLAGSKLEGLGILKAWTIAGNRRMIGNIVIDTNIAGKNFKMVGFENHSGKTFLEKMEPLGKVIIGNGNNGEDKTEGCIYKNVYGTYLHGPVLPKNPEFADILIETALKRKYGKVELTPLDDSLEQQAKQSLIERFIKK